MTRLQLETEVYVIMGLLTPLGALGSIPTHIRTYVQNKIQSAINGIWSECGYGFRRRSFGAYLAAPVTTGTIAIVRGQSTGILTGVTPDSSWIGGHIVISANQFPLRIESVSGQTLTFSMPIFAPTDAVSGYTMYFDGFMLPVNCQSIDEGSLKLSGKRKLAYHTKTQFDAGQGFVSGAGTDYGFWGGYLGTSSSVIQTPTVGEPYVYTSFSTAVLTGIVRRIINVYPFPATNYVLDWEGTAKPTALSADGDIPEIPEQFHNSVLLPRIKLEMTEFPGFELSASEKQTLQMMYTMNLSSMKDEDRRQDTSEVQPNRPSSFCR